MTVNMDLNECISFFIYHCPSISSPLETKERENSNSISLIGQSKLPDPSSHLKKEKERRERAGRGSGVDRVGFKLSRIRIPLTDCSPFTEPRKQRGKKQKGRGGERRREEEERREREEEERRGGEQRGRGGEERDTQNTV